MRTRTRFVLAKGTRRPNTPSFISTFLHSLFHFPINSHIRLFLKYSPYVSLCIPTCIHSFLKPPFHCIPLHPINKITKPQRYRILLQYINQSRRKTLALLRMEALFLSRARTCFYTPIQDSMHHSVYILPTIRTFLSNPTPAMHPTYIHGHNPLFNPAIMYSLAHFASNRNSRIYSHAPSFASTSSRACAPPSRYAQTLRICYAPACALYPLTPDAYIYIHPFILTFLH